jgi:hypothetical protein
VDATKTFWGGVNRIGFSRIEDTIESLTPGAAASGLTQAKIVDTLRSSWYIGKDLGSQKSVAKTLIKVNMTPANAATLAAATGVDAQKLASVATKIVSGKPLEQDESDVYSRFDLILTALLDEVYQDSDQAYVNGTRFTAFLFAVALAFVGGWTLKGGSMSDYWWSKEMAEALIAGLLATPLAPIAKDLSSALATAVNTLQAVRK